MQQSMMATIDSNTDGIITTTAMRTLMATVRPAPTTVGMKCRNSVNISTIIILIER